MKLTDISAVGEFGLIRYLTQDIKTQHDSTIVGIGDDAAVLEYTDKQTVVTTDLLVEGVHFDLMYVPLKHLGYKAVAVNLSDVYAMNATPRQITVSLAVSSRFTVEALDELYKGIKAACARYGVDIIGGDTTSSQRGMIISITAIGEVEKGQAVYRSGAKENDLICVSGNLGAAYMGLQLLEREKEVFKANPKAQPELSGWEYIVERQLKPEPRRDIIDLLRKNDIRPTSMIDISDGLSSEILHICSASDKGCKIFDNKLPIHEQTKEMAREMNLEPSVCALNGGEDYELLFTCAPTDYEKLRNISEITVIGHILPANQGYYLIGRDGTHVPIKAQGWNALLEE